jgi:hypothetical protein
MFVTSSITQNVILVCDDEAMTTTTTTRSTYAAEREAEDERIERSKRSAGANKHNKTAT